MTANKNNNGPLRRKARAKNGAKRAPRSLVDQGRLVTQAEARKVTARVQMDRLIDKACGPNGVLILHALAVIALGDAQARQQFFGEAFRVQAKDRNVALAHLALRRYGRAPLVVPVGDPTDPMNLPVVIQHIYSGEVIDVEPLDA